MANLAVIFIAVLYRFRCRQIGAAAMRINGYNAAHQLTYSKEFSWQQDRSTRKRKCQVVRYPLMLGFFSVRCGIR